ncbi:MAG: SNARE associated protein [Bacteroidetes bacterium]|nr:MAG: SNARE associated protein [Bacteroidota bacterium]
MEVIKDFLDVLLHINDYLDKWVVEYGTLIYGILFLIIFVETGLVVMPFLPGDSLLFAAGALCAKGSLSLPLLMALLSVAAIAGDNTNYAIGRFFGERATRLRIGKRKLVKQEYIDKTHGFFEKYGTKAIIMARFVPFVRTFMPFVAGVGKMSYRKKFLPFDIAGGVLWIASMSLCGFFFGQIPWVQQHFELVVVGIIFISVLPMVIGFISHKMKKKA